MSGQYLKENECEGVDWNKLALDRVQWRALVNKIINLRVPYNAGEFLDQLNDYQHFSRITLLHDISKQT
jgi:hypothetical protein